MLFFAFLLVTNAKTVAELRVWAKNVYSLKAQAEENGALWKPPESKWPLRHRKSTLYEPMEGAYKNVRDMDTLLPNRVPK
jgi:hypothetical protein